MGLFDNFYLTFFSVGAIIPSVFSFLGAILIFTLKDTSKGTKLLGIALTLFTMFNSSYIVSSSFYTQYAAFHRWSTVFWILLLVISLAIWLFYFPTPRRTKFAKALAIVWILSSIVASAYFFIVTWNAPFKYHFNGHYWDFDAEKASYVISLIILLAIFTTVLTSLWRIIVAQKGSRKVMIMIFIGIFISTILPGVLNTLSRDGAIDRGLFQTVFSLLTLIGFFIIVVSWINLTKDKTTFMVKIIGISMVTFLLVLQGINYFIFLEQEKHYDQVCNLSMQRFLESGVKSHDLEYLAIYDLANDKPSFGFQKDRLVQFDRRLILNELYNTFIIEKIRNLPYGESRTNDLNSIISLAPSDFAGYKKSVFNFLQENKNATNEDILAHFDSLKRTLKYRSSKIRQIENSRFREKIQQFLESDYGDFNPFRDVMASHVKNSPSDGRVLKKEVLEYADTARPAGTRHYRTGFRGSKAVHYTAFILPDLKENKIYEAGFNYIAYREAIQNTAYMMLGTLVAILFIVLIGFRVFFSRTLTVPLGKLLDGVYSVNKGNLDTKVPIYVRDEIGFLSDHFNGMVKSIKDAKDKLQEYTETLEERVSERTAKLQHSLNEIKELKTQQDGDYFLTSLLTKPLGANKAKSETVHIDFLLRQKKKFVFRKWSRELGGDICISDSIILNNKPYTVFLNADAMGKSMQGAGGILVLGSVFSSLIENVKISKSNIDHFPEQWLKNSFTELHRIFETFDGSMLISLVTGLIDDKTGLMYYINAEHPWSVLYRDGKADFIENELAFRKLGTQGLSGRISVSTFQLEVGDVLFVGSDGRDDILLETTQSGARVINEDETLFLKVVQKAKGQLSAVENELNAFGELTDDLSLIRIAYRENILQVEMGKRNDEMLNFFSMGREAIKKGNIEEAADYLEKAHSIDTSHPELLKSLAKIYLKQKNYAKAALFAEDYVILRPGDTDMVYAVSYCLKMTNNLTRAIDFGERVRLREPGSIRNIKNLADCYHLVGNTAKAVLLIEMALKFAPTDQDLLRLKTKLKEMVEV